MDLIDLQKYDLEYDLEYDFAFVTDAKNGLVDIQLMQRNFSYKDCIVIGNYCPIINEKGIVLFVSKIKYPCFIPFNFLNRDNNSIYKPNDIVISSIGKHEVETKNLDADFLNKVIEISNNLQINYNDLLLIMQFESELNSKAKNKKTNATGLIQFLPSTAISLGTTVDELYNMSSVEQLIYVEKYFKNVISSYGKLSTLQDLCMSVFYPIYIGKSSDTIFPENVQRVNKGIVTIQNYVDLVLNKSNKTSGRVKMSGSGTISLEH